MLLFVSADDALLFVSVVFHKPLRHCEHEALCCSASLYPQPPAGEILFQHSAQTN
jgi:hypothetical protein